MLGAIAGDIIGSPYEFGRMKSKHFPLFSDSSGFTDDTVMTVAVAEALIAADGDTSVGEEAVVASMLRWGAAYPSPKGGYGARFGAWLFDDHPRPYGSWGNGSAMRVSPVASYFGTLEEVEQWAAISARVSHDHPEGIRGAQATASAVFLAGRGVTKAGIAAHITQTYGYDLTRTLDAIRPGYRHVESCQETVPEAITAYLEADGFEDAVRGAVSLGGDADTLGAITGAIAEAGYGGVPEAIAAEALARLDARLRQAVEKWYQALESRRAQRP
jgi:ADP-ribosylglycohydrolase